MSNKSIELAIYGTLVTIGAAAGFTGGYFFAKKKFQAIAEEEIFEIKKTYRQAQIQTNTTLEDLQKRYQGDRPSDIEAEVKPMSPDQLKETLGYVPGEFLSGRPERSFVEDPAVTTGREVLRGSSFPDEVEGGNPAAEEDEEQVTNVFDVHGDEEAFTKREGQPYLISDETYHEPTTHEQLTLTYYAGDEALADEGLHLVDSISEVVGTRALSMFGVRSGDPDIVYVRNERFGADYEIVRVEGTYGEQINADPQE